MGDGQIYLRYPFPFERQTKSEFDRESDRAWPLHGQNSVCLSDAAEMRDQRGTNERMIYPRGNGPRNHERRRKKKLHRGEARLHKKETK